MCDCDLSKNIVDLPHIKIYLEMAEYKIKDGFEWLTWTKQGSYKIQWTTATQEELAYAYEEKGLEKFIEKITNKSKDGEKANSTTKKSSKKPKSKDKGTDKEE